MREQTAERHDASHLGANGLPIRRFSWVWCPYCSTLLAKRAERTRP